MRRLIFLGLLIALLPLPVAADDVPADADRILQRIFTDWAARRERFDQASYVLAGQVLRPQGCFNPIRREFQPVPQGDLPPRPLMMPTSVRLEIDFENGRARFERVAERFGPDPEFRRISETLVFDGERHTRYTPRSENPWYDLDSLAMSELEDNERIVLDFFFDESVRPLFFGHGFVPPPKAATALAGPADLPDLHIAGEALHGGRRCVVLRTPEKKGFFREYVVDVEHSSAVVRYAENVRGVETRVVAVTYRETPDGWLPERWTDATLGLGTAELFRSETLRVVEYKKEPDLPVERFRIAPAQGMVLWRKGKFILYQGEDQPPLDAKDVLRGERRAGPV